MDILHPDLSFFKILCLSFWLPFAPGPSAVSCLAAGQAPGEPDVYVAGSEDRSDDEEVALLWKNGRGIRLGDPDVSSVAADVLVAGKDVLVVGSEERGQPALSAAMLWRNGRGTRLSDGRHRVAALAVAVSGTDVYVAGFMRGDDARVAMVWKNGRAIPITDGKHDAVATTIACTGADVVVGGSEDVGAPYPFPETTRNESVATVWRNGVPTRLTDGTRSSEVRDLALWGTTVYATGTEEAPAGPNELRNRALVWKLGPSGPAVQTELTHGGTFASVAGICLGATAPPAAGP